MICKKQWFFAKKFFPVILNVDSFHYHEVMNLLCSSYCLLIKAIFPRLLIKELQNWFANGQ